MTTRKERARKRYHERKNEYTDRGRDATRMLRLDEEQIQVLVSRLPAIEIVTHGLDDQEYWCNFSVGTITSVNTCAAIPLPVRFRRLEDKFPLLPGFSPAAVLLAANGEFAQDIMDEASHLCGNAHCLRIEHLLWETHQANMDRIGCPGIIRSQDLGDLVACTHSPTCVKITTNNYLKIPKAVKL